MITINGVIVNTKRQLIGLIMRGKEEDFGGRGTAEVEKNMAIQSLPVGFRTHQIEITKSGIKELGSFKLNALELMRVLVNEQCIDIGNSMEVIKQYRMNGESYGFAVKFSDGTVVNMINEDIAVKATYFRPVNFVVRHMGDKYVICGKNGISVEDLPQQEIGRSEREATNKVKEVRSIHTYEEISGIKIDVLDIYEYTRKVGGMIVKLPDEKYKMAVGGVSASSDEKLKLSSVEVAFPEPRYSDSKINVTLQFKKLGVVKSDSTGREYDTYVHSAKCIFLNGKSTMNTMAMLVPKGAEDYFTCKRELKAEVIEDDKIMRELGRITNINGMVLVKIDTAEIGLMADSKRKSSIKAIEEIKELAIDIYVAKLMGKVLGNNGELIKSIKKDIGAEEYARITGKELYFKYRGMGINELQDIKNSGINIFTGEYLPSDRYSGKSANSAGNNICEDISIEYIFEQFDYTKVTGKQVIAMSMANDLSMITEEMRNMINYIVSRDSLEEQVVEAKKLMDRVDKTYSNATRALWMHKVAMLLEGRGKYIHVHDREKWSKDLSSRASKYQVYIADVGGYNIRAKVTGAII